ncbi:hypothetical protein PCL_00597 [Purpureocillium lilacinum]|uniref:Uncharacterized protein n=1 Tax=Purpureocillium lilacinum TaxID=33203 RepID=A0A2U3E586_PURLI|nr:hypothetical protein PCL_00597 [Purpureocillium lilacinum]
MTPPGHPGGLQDSGTARRPVRPAARTILRSSSSRRRSWAPLDSGIFPTTNGPREGPRKRTIYLLGHIAAPGYNSHPPPQLQETHPRIFLEATVLVCLPLDVFYSLTVCPHRFGVVDQDQSPLYRFCLLLSLLLRDRLPNLHAARPHPPASSTHERLPPDEQRLQRLDTHGTTKTVTRA